MRRGGHRRTECEASLRPTSQRIRLRPLAPGDSMLLDELALELEAQILTHQSEASRIQIDQVCIATRMSELLEKVTSATLLVSELSNPHLMRVAELLDVPSICFVHGATPSDPIVRAATENGKVLLLAPAAVEDTCRRLAELGVRCIR